jgi:hypothetical protein
MLHIIQCDDTSLYQNSLLSASINLLLELPQVVNREQGSKYDSAHGNVLTSVGNEWSDIINMPGAGKLVDWITERVLITNSKATGVNYTKSWCNKMMEGSEGLVHAHLNVDLAKKPDFVCIFYYQVPEDGANLVFIDGGEFNTHYYEYDESKITTIKSLTGRLVIHSPDIPHAVTKHNSKTPRICLVFEGTYIV